jgi:Phosphotransferase enzyme family
MTVVVEAVAAWIRTTLGGADTPVELTEHLTQPWSTTWKVTAGPRRFWFKQSCPSHAAEGAVHAQLAAHAPDFVDAPAAVETTRRWILSPDGGTTLLDSAPETRGVETGTLIPMLEDYARLQRISLAYKAELTSAGLRETQPKDAARRAAHQAGQLAEHLTEQQHRIVKDALPELEAAGRRLAAGPVPTALDHGDLWPGNVLVPRPDGHYRFFDFADAQWAHPFSSLVMLASECLYRWEIPQPDDAIDLRDDRIRAIFDAYLQHWTDFAPIAKLRQLAAHALRIAPLHRSAAWLANLQDAGKQAREEHGSMPWTWLEDVRKPVLL